jgi:WD40 repeat protein
MASFSGPFSYFLLFLLSAYPMETKRISVLNSVYELKQTLISDFETSSCYVFQVARNATNTRIATPNSSNKIKIYDTETLSIIGSLEGHTDTVNEVKFAKTHNDVLFSCSSDRTLRVWDTRTTQQGPCYRGKSRFYQQVHNIFQGTSGFFSFDTNEDESTLASASSTSIYMWYYSFYIEL